MQSHRLTARLLIIDQIQRLTCDVPEDYKVFRCKKKEKEKHWNTDQFRLTNLPLGIRTKWQTIFPISLCARDLSHFHFKSRAHKHRLDDSRDSSSSTRSTKIIQGNNSTQKVVFGCETWGLSLIIHRLPRCLLHSQHRLWARDPQFRYR